MDVVLSLDDYNDMFDDFDIRPYDKRAISVDFLGELQKRISKIRSNKIKIVLTLPKYKRIRGIERIIIKNLRSSFENRFAFYSWKKKESWIRIGMFVLLSLGSMAASFYTVDISKVLSEYFMIGIYFFTWQGLDEFIYRYPKIGKKVDHYKSLKEAHISFSDEETYSS